MFVIHGLKGGGTERVALNILKGLKSKNCDIKVVMYEQVFEYRMPDNTDIQILNIKSGNNIFTLLTGFIKKIWAIARSIKDFQPDAVISFLGSTNVALILARIISGLSPRVVVTEHYQPSIILANEKYGSITRCFMKMLYRKADIVVSVSKGIEKDLINNFGLKNNSVKTIYNPIDITEIKDLSREPVTFDWFDITDDYIVTAGRLTYLKGHEYLLSAFKTVRKKISCKLIIVGDGDERPRLERVAKQYGIEEDVYFTGFLENPFSLISKAKVFVLPSLTEGFGNVILESMALGVPVISTSCPSGPVEIIKDGESGILVPVKDTDALAQAILRLLTDQDLRKRLVAAGMVRVNDFKLDHISKEYWEVLFEDSSSSI